MAARPPSSGKDGEPPAEVDPFDNDKELFRIAEIPDFSLPRTLDTIRHDFLRKSMTEEVKWASRTDKEVDAEQRRRDEEIDPPDGYIGLAFQKLLRQAFHRREELQAAAAARNAERISPSNFRRMHLPIPPPPMPQPARRPQRASFLRRWEASKERAEDVKLSAMDDGDDDYATIANAASYTSGSREPKTPMRRKSRVAESPKPRMESHRQISIQQLQEFKKLWAELSPVTGVLNERQFEDLLSTHFSFSGTVVSDFFAKIDAEAAGAIKYDQFLGFLMEEAIVMERQRDRRELRYLKEYTPNNYQAVRHNHMIDRVLPIPEFDLLLTCGRDAKVHMWSLTTGELRFTFPFDAHNSALREPLADLVALVNGEKKKVVSPPLAEERLFLLSQDFDAKFRPPPSSRTHSRIHTPTARPPSAGAPSTGRTSHARIARRRGIQKVMNNKPETVLTDASGEALSALHVFHAESGLAGHTKYGAHLHRVCEPENFERLAEKGRVQTAAEMGILPIPHSTGPNTWLSWPVDMAYVPGRRLVAVAGLDRTVSLHQPLHRFREVGCISVAHVPLCVAWGVQALSGRDVLVVGDMDGGVSLFDVETKALLVRSRLHDGAVRRVRILPHAGLVSAGEDGALVISDTDELTIYRELTGPTGALYCLDYDESLRYLASAGRDSRVYIHDPAQAKACYILSSHGAPVVEVAFHKGGTQLFTITADKTVRVWETQGFTCYQTFVAPTVQWPDDQLTAAAVDLRNQRLLVAGNVVRYFAIDAVAHTSSETEPGPGKHIVAVMFSPKLRQLVCVGKSGRVRVWDVVRRKDVFEFTAKHEATVVCATLGTHRRRLVTGDAVGIVKLWNFNSGQMICVLAQCRSPINCLISRPLAPDDEVAYMRRPYIGATDDGRLVAWAPPEANVASRTLSGHVTSVRAVEACGHRLLASVGDDHRIVVWYPESGVIHGKITIPARGVVTRLLYLGSAGLVVGTSSGVCLLVDPVGCTVISEHAFQVAGEVGGMGAAVGKEDARLLVGDSIGRARLWDISKLQAREPSTTLVREWEAHTKAGITSVCYVQVVALFALGTDRGEVSLWTADAGLLTLHVRTVGGPAPSLRRPMNVIMATALLSQAWLKDMASPYQPGEKESTAAAPATAAAPVSAAVNNNS